MSHFQLQQSTVQVAKRAHTCVSPGHALLRTSVKFFPLKLYILLQYYSVRINGDGNTNSGIAECPSHGWKVWCLAGVLMKGNFYHQQ